MRFTTLVPEELGDREQTAWSRLQRDVPGLDSPFFSPGFVQAVAAVRSDVRVVVLEDQQRPVGFFPYQRERGRTAGPVAAGFSEFHGLIAAPAVTLPAGQLLAGCRLSAWHYDHVPATQPAFQACHAEVGDSPFLDLSAGFAAYCTQKRQSGSQVVIQTQRKARKLEREVGPLRFELHEPSEEALGHLLSWKAAQHQRTGVLDVFQFPWVVRLLRQIRDTRTDGFRGCLSVLYAAERPLAVHLGLCSDRVAHVWYPAYDEQYARYSPGMILFLEWMRALAESGIRRVDFGPGSQRYKQSLMTGAIPVARGTADRGAAARLARRAWTKARRGLSASPLRRTLQLPARAAFRLRQWRALRNPGHPYAPSAPRHR